LPKPEDFHLGADVYSSDGKHVGTLERLVVAGDDLDLHEVVVKESKGFSGRLLAPRSALMADELIVPLSAITEVTADRITLNLDAPAARRLKPYLSYRYAPIKGRDVVRMASALLGGVYVPKLEEQSAAAPGELEISADESIAVGATGRQLGEVRDVLVEDDDVVGVVVDRGLFARDFILPRRFLSRGEGGELVATLSDEDLEHLQPFDPAD